MYNFDDQTNIANEKDGFHSGRRWLKLLFYNALLLQIPILQNVQNNTEKCKQISLYVVEKNTDAFEFIQTNTSTSYLFSILKWW